MRKACRKCGRELPIDQFYRHSMMADGHLNFCKLCVRKRVRAHREVNEHVRGYDRERAKTPARKVLSRENTKRWRIANPEKYQAETAVGNAVRDGKLARGVCEVCGATRVHAHINNYSKPLDVTWLCAKHHHRLHAKIRMTCEAHSSPHTGGIIAPRNA